MIYVALVTHQVTIEVYVTVEADSEQEALDQARTLESDGYLDYSIPTLRYPAVADDLFMEYEGDSQIEIMED